MAHPQSPGEFQILAAEGPTAGAAWTRHSNDAYPKYSALSKTHWEMWMLEGIEQTGNAGVTVTFFIDGSQTFHGNDPLHITFHALLPDGAIEKHHLIAAAVRVRETDASIVLEWPSKENGDGTEANSFSRIEVAQDHSSATATFNVPGAVQGSLALTSYTRSPDPTAGALGPAVSHRQIMTGAHAESDLSFPGSGRRLRFAGKGGHDRCWMEAAFPAILSDTTYVRGHAGPYTFASLGVVSRMGESRGRNCQKFRLLRDGVEVFASKSDTVSLTEDYFVLRSSHGGPVKGPFLDTTTGYRLDFVRPRAGKHWAFEIAHEKVWWSMPLGPPPLVREGNSGFVSKVRGGEVGGDADGETFEGAGDIGQIQMPELSTLVELKTLKAKAAAAATAPAPAEQ
ncbi:hypothetical protein MPH_07627 [Macrophomina phaseolina MS6]|uniref:Diels-Alderase mpsD n=1 Tax=Macrophomina phaseolina (strain MS6) TaxID=1126212 RepID=MPSD_MACPH|nr:RecName: Full=Diels-Alderase mpsD; AltName: Full=Macrophasetins biosynthesis cluster protein D [Macrophomina phaseolina MS6]EKG15180.1 hypothetical protein MPH_07627 [Macrophomina phaseolina MS6]